MRIPPDRLQNLISRLERKPSAHPIDEYDRQNEDRATTIEERIDVWFSVWLIVQFTVLPTLFWLGIRLRRSGIGLLQIGFDDSWLLTILAVQWCFLLAAAVRTTVLAIANHSLIRRRMLVLGFIPWAVIVVETTLALVLLF
jgi:hypothetical protein